MKKLKKFEKEKRFSKNAQGELYCTLYQKKREIKGRELKLRTKNDLNENTTSLKKKKKWK